MRKIVISVTCLLLGLNSCGFQFRSDSDGTSGDSIEDGLNDTNTVGLRFRINQSAVNQHNFAFLSKAINSRKDVEFPPGWPETEIETAGKVLSYVEGEDIEGLESLEYTAQGDLVFLTVHMLNDQKFLLKTKQHANWLGWSNRFGEAVTIQKRNAYFFDLRVGEEMISWNHKKKQMCYRQECLAW